MNRGLKKLLSINSYPRNLDPGTPSEAKTLKTPLMVRTVICKVGDAKPVFLRYDEAGQSATPHHPASLLSATIFPSSHQSRSHPPQSHIQLTTPASNHHNHIESPTLVLSSSQFPTRPTPHLARQEPHITKHTHLASLADPAAAGSVRTAYLLTCCLLPLFTPRFWILLTIHILSFNFAEDCGDITRTSCE